MSRSVGPSGSVLAAEEFPYKVGGIGGDKIPTSLHCDVIDEFLPGSDAGERYVMATCRVSEVPVLDGADCVGSLSEEPLMARVLADQKLLERRVSAVMRPPFPVADAGAPIERPLPLVARESTAGLVRRDGALAGFVTRYDVLRHVAGIR